MQHSVRSSTSYTLRGHLLCCQKRLLHWKGLILTHKSDKDGHHDDKLDPDMFDDVDQRTEDNDSCVHTEPNSSLPGRSNGRCTQRMVQVTTYGCPGFSLPACYARGIYDPMANGSVLSMLSCNLINSRDLRRPDNSRREVTNSTDSTNNAQHRESSDVFEDVDGYKCIWRLRKSLPEAEYDQSDAT